MCYAYICTISVTCVNAVSAQPCVGKLQISHVLLNFLGCNFGWWFKKFSIHTKIYIVMHMAVSTNTSVKNCNSNAFHHNTKQYSGGSEVPETRAHSVQFLSNSSHFSENSAK